MLVIVTNFNGRHWKTKLALSNPIWHTYKFLWLLIENLAFIKYLMFYSKYRPSLPVLYPIFLTAYGYRVSGTFHLLRLSTNRPNLATWYLSKEQCLVKTVQDFPTVFCSWPELSCSRVVGEFILKYSDQSLSCIR